MVRVLKPGGSIAITLQNERFLSNIDVSRLDRNTWLKFIYDQCIKVFGSVSSAQAALDSGQRLFFGPYRGLYYGDHFCTLTKFLSDLPGNLKMIKYIGVECGLLNQDVLLLRKQ
jgi:hypothetical protein